MRHLVSKPKLSRTRNQRHALVKNLLSDFFLQEAIVTTVAKAKFIKPQVENSITIAKKGTLASHRQLVKMIGSDRAVKSLINKIAPAFTRTSGFTRLTPVALRRGDNTLMVKLSLIEKDQEVVLKNKVVKEKSNKSSKETKKVVSVNKKASSKTVNKKGSVKTTKVTKDNKKK